MKFDAIKPGEKPLATVQERQTAKRATEMDYPGSASYLAALSADDLGVDRGPYYQRELGGGDRGLRTRERTKNGPQRGGTKDTA